MKNFLHNGRQALLVTIVLLLICGLLFPLLLTGLSKVFFPSQAAGSLVTVDGQVVGAKNVGQEFTEDYYLWGRPSAYHYNTYVEQEDTREVINITELNAEIKRIVAREQVLRDEIDKIIAEIEVG